MKITEIIESWERDSEVNRADLGGESLRVPRLHSKYLKILFQEKLLFEKIKSEFDEMFLLRTLYYNCELKQEFLQEKGWPPFHHKLMKADREMYMAADTFLQDIRTRMTVQKEKILMLEDILKSIHNRQYTIRTAVDWEKFTSGG